MSCSAWTMKSNPLWTLLLTLVAAACMSTLTGCSKDRPVYYATGQAYIQLQSGQTFVAPRDMTLATEAVIQQKDQQILDLIQSLMRLQEEFNQYRTH